MPTQVESNKIGLFYVRTAPQKVIGFVMLAAEDTGFILFLGLPKKASQTRVACLCEQWRWPSMVFDLLEHIAENYILVYKTLLLNFASVNYTWTNRKKMSTSSHLESEIIFFKEVNWLDLG